MTLLVFYRKVGKIISWVISIYQFSICWGNKKELSGFYSKISPKTVQYKVQTGKPENLEKNFLNNPSIKLWTQNCEEKENNLA